MKKYIYFIIAVLGGLSVLTSCDKDFLTEAPVLSQSPAVTLSNMSNVNLAVAGAYAPLVSSSWYGEDFILSNEMRTMNGKRWIGSSHDSGRYKDDYLVNFTPTVTSGVWAYAYYVILSANQVLGAIDGITGDEQTKKNYKAECLFLRALSHFDLVRTFAMPYNYTSDASHLGVPVVTTVQAMTEKPARNTVAEVYSQILTDLKDAETMIDPSYVRSGTTDTKATVNIYVIEALLSRVYLYMGNWQACADYATKVIDSGKYTMWSKKDVQDAACFRLDVPKGGEIIFETYGAKANEYDGYHDSLWSLSSPKGEYGDCGASADLLNLYAEGDVRSSWLSPDNKGNCLFTMKYAGKGIGSPDQNNTVVLRLSEMYLNRAEAVVNGAKGASAVADLKVIASNRGAEAETANLTGVYSERAKELCWEGHLWFDLARTKRDMTRTDVATSAIPTSIPAGDHKWAMPIPEREIIVNSSLVQNDGYSK
ncbi:MAG: RagB/SusD family nutrient uptake outer membrane protein [Bacteroidales bacterium]